MENYILYAGFLRNKKRNFVGYYIVKGKQVIESSATEVPNSRPDIVLKYIAYYYAVKNLIKRYKVAQKQIIIHIQKVDNASCGIFETNKIMEIKTEIKKLLKDKQIQTVTASATVQQNIARVIQKKFQQDFIMSYNIFVDGCSKGNPGPAGAGAVCYKDKKVVFEECKFLGTKTNNEAEYSALILGLETAKNKQLDNITIYSDSELIVFQIQGHYGVSNSRMRNYYEKAIKIFNSFKNIEIKHIPRTQNQKADWLANKAVKEYRESQMVNI